MWRLARYCLAWLLLTAGAQVAAETMITRVFTLGYRPALEVMAIIQPLVPAPGAVSGVDSTLVVRSTPAVMADIERVIAQLDRTPRTLLISVRQGAVGEAQLSQAELSARGRLGDVRTSSGGTARSHGGHIGARIVDSHTRSDAREVQSLRVLEGRQAFIRTGQAIPFPEQRISVGHGVTTLQDGIRFEDVTSGFYVVPRLDGKRVTLEISAQRERLASTPYGGTINIQEAATVVSGHLGEWIALGAVEDSIRTNDGGIAYSTAGRWQRHSGTFVKVELAD